VNHYAEVMKITPRTLSQPTATQPEVRNHTHFGFTLTELLVVLASLAVLALVVLPAVAGTQPRSKGFQCLNNMRQLAQAWTLYASENNEKLVLNSDPHVSSSGYLFSGVPSWATGLLDWTAGSQNTNTAYLTSDRYSSLANYLGHSPGVFACPAENDVSPMQRMLGWDHRARSVAMNAAVGDGSKYLQPANPFDWSQWYVAKKTTDFRTPSPGQTWVFSDEHPDSIDDILMYVAPYPTTFIEEFPGNEHDGAAGITFADGHADMHKWSGAMLNSPVRYVTVQRSPCLLTDPDMLWLEQHTPRSP